MAEVTSGLRTTRLLIKPPVEWVRPHGRVWVRALT